MFLLTKLKLFLFRLYYKRKLFKLGYNSFILNNAKIINSKRISIGENVHICEDAWLNCGGNQNLDKVSLHIHDNCYFGRMLQINAWKDVVIENHVLIADRVMITDADHNYKNPSLPIIKQGDRFVGSVHIKSGAWIGINAVIMPGVTIGKNSVVCPNSVVLKDVEDYNIVSGVPAQVIMKL